MGLSGRMNLQKAVGIYSSDLTEVYDTRMLDILREGGDF